ALSLDIMSGARSGPARFLSLVEVKTARPHSIEGQSLRGYLKRRRRSKLTACDYNVERKETSPNFLIAPVERAQIPQPTNIFISPPSQVRTGKGVSTWSSMAAIRSTPT